MSWEEKENPWKVIRKKVPPPSYVIQGSKYRKRKIKQEEQELIYEGILDYLEDEQ